MERGEEKATRVRERLIMTRRMKIAATITLLGCLTASASVRAQLSSEKYSGNMKIDELGQVSFPAGHWILEFKRIQPANVSKRPDYFVFKKSGEQLERLAILRYSPDIAPKRLNQLIDGLIESMWDGIPTDAKMKEDISGGQSIVLQEPRDWDAKHLDISFISKQRTGKLWLCHAFLISKDDWMFVGVLASPNLTWPESLADVGTLSRFSTTLMQRRRTTNATTEPIP